MNFSQIYTQVGNFIQDDSTPRQTRIKDSINRRYDEIARGTDWPELIKIYSGEVSSNGTEANVYLPIYIDVIKKVVSDSDNQILHNYDPETFFTRNYDNISLAGNPTEYTHNGISAVKRDISSAETLDFVSSDSGDTSLDIEVWGLVDGDEVNETVTLNGTSAVTTSNSFSRVTKIGTAATSLNAQRSGVITVSGTTSSTEYATISPHMTESTYSALRLFPVASANNTLTVVYKKRVVPLVNDGDTLEIPIAPALVELSIADILRQQHKWSAAREHEGRGQRMLIDYQSRLLMQTEQVQQGVPTRSNMFGPQRVVIKGS